VSELTLALMARNNNKPSEFELKGKPINPCPFCGSEDIYVVDNSDWGMCWCGCAQCGTEGPCRPDRFNAIAMWQKRK